MSKDLLSTATLLRGALERVERQLSRISDEEAANREPSREEPRSLNNARGDSNRNSQMLGQGSSRESSPRTELRRIFYEPDVSHTPPQQSGSGRKRRHKKESVAKANNNWKKDTICLRFKEQHKGPNMEEKMILAKAGLGLKELIFSNDGDALHIHYVITEAFKELEKAGGYTLLHLATNSTTLLAIEPPKGGMNVRYLKDILKSAKLFVRPLQSDINIADHEKNADSEPEVPYFTFFGC